MGDFRDLLVLVCYTVVPCMLWLPSSDSSVPSASPTSFGVSLVDCFGEFFIQLSLAFKLFHLTRQ